MLMVSNLYLKDKLSKLYLEDKLVIKTEQILQGQRTTVAGRLMQGRILAVDSTR